MPNDNWIRRSYRNIPRAKLLRITFPLVVLISSIISLLLSKNGDFDASDFFNLVIIVSSALDLYLTVMDEITFERERSDEEISVIITWRNFFAFLIGSFITVIFVTLIFLV